MSPPPASTSPMITSSTSSGRTPDRSKAALTTRVARSSAGVSRSVPLKAVAIGVLTALTMTASGMVVLLCFCGTEPLLLTPGGARGMTEDLARQTVDELRSRLGSLDDQVVVTPGDDVERHATVTVEHLQGVRR